MNVSREAYETLVRRLVVRNRKNITFVSGTVIGYIGEAGEERLKGVKYTKAPVDEGEVVVVNGEFVVGMSTRTFSPLHCWQILILSKPPPYI